MTSPALPEPNDSLEPVVEEEFVPEELGPRQMPTSQPVFVRALRWGLVVSVLLVIVFAVIGWLVDGSRGVIGGVIGSGIGAAMVLLTVGSIAFANRFIEKPSYLGIFAGVVLGGWAVKFIAFIVVMVLLRGQEWLHPLMLFFGLVASIVLSLALDAIIALKSRVAIAVPGV